MSEILPSAVARERLPKLIDQLVDQPADVVVIGRHRRREAVLMAASRYDEMLEREAAVRDLAWALHARERVARAEGAPVDWDTAVGRRRGLA